jgi:hypothetical protein
MKAFYSVMPLLEAKLAKRVADSLKEMAFKFGILLKCYPGKTGLIT